MLYEVNGYNYTIDQLRESHKTVFGMVIYELKVKLGIMLNLPNIFIDEIEKLNNSEEEDNDKEHIDDILTPLSNIDIPLTEEFSNIQEKIEAKAREVVEHIEVNFLYDFFTNFRYDKDLFKEELTEEEFIKFESNYKYILEKLKGRLAEEITRENVKQFTQILVIIDETLMFMSLVNDCELIEDFRNTIDFILSMS